MTDEEWAEKVALLRPKAGARVRHADGSLGTVLACPDSQRSLWLALIEWDEGTSRERRPSVEDPAAFHVKLVTVEPST